MIRRGRGAPCLAPPVRRLAQVRTREWLGPTASGPRGSGPRPSCTRMRARWPAPRAWRIPCRPIPDLHRCAAPVARHLAGCERPRVSAFHRQRGRARHRAVLDLDLHRHPRGCAGGAAAGQRRAGHGVRGGALRPGPGRLGAGDGAAAGQQPRASTARTGAAAGRGRRRGMGDSFPRPHHAVCRPPVLWRPVTRTRPRQASVPWSPWPTSCPHVRAARLVRGTCRAPGEPAVPGRGCGPCRDPRAETSLHK